MVVFSPTGIIQTKVYLTIVSSTAKQLRNIDVKPFYLHMPREFSNPIPTTVFIAPDANLT